MKTFLLSRQKGKKEECVCICRIQQGRRRSVCGRSRKLRVTNETRTTEKVLYEMADDGEVSALVCDNGSGMVKVRERELP